MTPPPSFNEIQNRIDHIRSYIQQACLSEKLLEDISDEIFKIIYPEEKWLLDEEGLDTAYLDYLMDGLSRHNFFVDKCCSLIEKMAGCQISEDAEFRRDLFRSLVRQDKILREVSHKIWEARSK